MCTGYKTFNFSLPYLLKTFLFFLATVIDWATLEMPAEADA
jgi:hypothetical protein